MDNSVPFSEIAWNPEMPDYPNYYGSAPSFATNPYYDGRESEAYSIIRGDSTRRSMMKAWFILAIAVIALMIYFAYAALTDKIPFSVRMWVPGGRVLPKPIERTS